MVMFPTVTVLKFEPDTHENPLNVTPLTVTSVPVAMGPKFAEANSVPVVTTSEDPEIVTGVPHAMVAAFAGWRAIERNTAVIAAATAATNDFRKLVHCSYSQKNRRTERNEIQIKT